VFAGLFLFWFLDKLVIMIWTLVADSFRSVPEAETVSIYVSLCSLVTAVVVVWRLYVNEKVNRLAHDVVGELAKVTWPTRREVSYSTVVVIITSVIAAIILGTFDAVWSTVTDLIY
jgi:preprotein translocase subunit SecE